MRFRKREGVAAVILLIGSVVAGCYAEPEPNFLGKAARVETPPPTAPRRVAVPEDDGVKRIAEAARPMPRIDRSTTFGRAVGPPTGVTPVGYAVPDETVPDESPSSRSRPRDRGISRRVRDGAVEISFDDLDLLTLLGVDPVPPEVADRLPASVTGLDGRRVRIRGFMYPTYEDPIRAFVLARDNEICCFGRDPKVYDLIPVLLAAGTTTPYVEGIPFDVVGTFRVKPKVVEGRWYRLYMLEDAAVSQ